MKKLAAIVLATSVLCLSTACTLTRGSSILVGEARPAIDPTRVRLVTTLPERYERIALVSADSRNDFASQQNLSDAAIHRLKEEAAKVGANGVLLNGIGNYQVGASGIVVPTAGGPMLTGAMNSRTGKEATGLAIYIPEQ